MAAVNLRFGLNADDFINGVALVQNQTRSMSNAVERQIEGLNRQLHQIRGTTSEYERYRAAARGATLEQRRQIEAVLRAIDVERQNQSAMRDSHSSQLRIADSLKTMAAGYISIHGAASLLRTADTYQGLENRLRLVTNSQLELNQAMQDTKNIALQTSMQWESVASIYQRFAQNGEKLGLSLQETADLTSTVAKTALISGGSMDSVNAALVQFGQALASGVLRGEEFNSIAEQQPALLQAIAQGLGVNIGQLRFMAADGMLTADVVTKALQDTADSVSDDFNKMEQTGAQALQNLSTRWTEFVGEGGKSTGAMKAFTTAVGLLSENLDTVAVMAFASGLAFLGKTTVAATMTTKGKIATLLSERQATIASTAAAAQAAHTERLRAMAELNSAHAAAARAAGSRSQAAADAALAVARARATAATIAETTATNAAAVAASRLAAAKTMLLGAMGGPAGLIVTGLAVGSMYAALQAPAADVNATLSAQSKTVEELAEQYKKLNDQQKLKFKAEALQGIKDAKAAMDTLYSPQKGTDALELNDEKYHNLLEIGALTPVLEDLKNGAIDGQEAMAKLEKTQLFSDEKLKDLTIGISKMEQLTNSLENYNDQLDLANGKESALGSKSKASSNGKANDNQASLTAEQALDFEAIKKTSDEFALMHANLGMSNEELKLAAMQQNLLNLANKGASAETIRAAELSAQLAERHYIEMQTAKQLDEMRQAETRQLEQNQKFVADELDKREQQIWQLGKSTEQLTAMALAAKGATETEQRKAVAMDRVISEYERQRNAMQTLEDMNKEIARLGKSDTEVKLMDLQDKGATAQQLALYKQQLEYVNQFKESQKLNDLSVKADGKTVASFSSAVGRFGESVKNQSDLSQLSKYERNKVQWEQIRSEEKAKNKVSYFGGGGWYQPSDKNATGAKSKAKAYQGPNSGLPKHFSDQVSKMSADLQNLGVLYLASSDNETDMAKVFASPENVKILKQIAQAGFKEMVREGAARTP